MRLNLRGRRRKAFALCCFAGNPFLSGTHATGSASQCGGKAAENQNQTLYNAHWLGASLPCDGVTGYQRTEYLCNRCIVHASILLLTDVSHVEEHRLMAEVPLPNPRLVLFKKTRHTRKGAKLNRLPVGDLW